MLATKIRTVFLCKFVKSLMSENLAVGKIFSLKFLIFLVDKGVCFDRCLKILSLSESTHSK